MRAWYQQPPDARTPATWKWVKLVKSPKRGRLAVVTSFLGSEFGPVALQAAGLDWDINPSELAARDAVEVGGKLEAFIATNAAQRRSKR